MSYLLFLFVSSIAFLIMVAVSPPGKKGLFAITGIILNAVLSSLAVANALTGESIEYIVYGGSVFGEIPLRIDALSAWFVLIMNFTAITAILYGNHYLQEYNTEPSRISLHYSCFILNHLSMIFIYLVQHSLVFLCFWEIMAISAFLLVIFDYHKIETLKAGINYLIQSHICILFLMLGFIWVSFKTGLYDFAAIAGYSSAVRPAIAFVLFFLFFVGFGFKAGFVPFHTWLPYAHPAAPAHVSGLMSGVIIKLGIYGIMRMLFLIEMNYVLAGTVILVISVITGIYGVMLAILQHNMKRLLAYHSIENIGIIGIGIGLGVIGKGLDNQFLLFAGWGGALLHTLNHSLFKSLLFFASGAVYQATHLLKTDKLGGLIKKMPHTAVLFLTASVAICGLPPFNGFVSEFLIYTGLFSALSIHNGFSFSVLIIISVLGLVLIGGLAIFCFTKAFGIVFLGESRSTYPAGRSERGWGYLTPAYMIAGLIVCIGLFPHFFISAVSRVIIQFAEIPVHAPPAHYFSSVMQKVGFASWLLIILALIIYGLKVAFKSVKAENKAPTWGCGYPAVSHKLQYTSSSFSMSYRNLIKPVVRISKRAEGINSVVPGRTIVETHVYDKLEYYFVDMPLKYLRSFLGRFRFLQNGSVQFYILYGVVFIFIAITIPFLIRTAFNLFDLFKQL